jgi:acylphosphatase
MTVHLLIKGKVQGVFYRASAKDVAKGLKLSGWVRNTRDGDVESIVTGDKDRVEEFIAWCKKGPSRADVTKVIVTKKEEEQFFDFVIVR